MNKVLNGVGQTIEIDATRYTMITVAILANTGCNLAFEISPDGRTWFSALALKADDESGVSSSGVGVTGLFHISVGGFALARARVTSIGTSATVQIIGSKWSRSPKRTGPPTTGLLYRFSPDARYFTTTTGKITTWQAMVGGAYAFTQATVGNAPTATANINGKTTVTFASPQLMAANATTTIGVFDIYVVCKTSAASGFLIGMSPAAVTNSNFVVARSAVGAGVYRASVGTTKDPTSATWLNNGVACLVRHGFDGTHAGHVLQRDGVDVVVGAPTASGNPGTGNITDFFFIGRASGMVDWGGDYGDILVYNSTPDTTRANQVRAWSHSYWATP